MPICLHRSDIRQRQRERNSSTGSVCAQTNENASNAKGNTWTLPAAARVGSKFFSRLLFTQLLNPVNRNRKLCVRLSDKCLQKHRSWFGDRYAALSLLPYPEKFVASRRREKFHPVEGIRFHGKSTEWTWWWQMTEDTFGRQIEKNVN